MSTTEMVAKIREEFSEYEIDYPWGLQGSFAIIKCPESLFVFIYNIDDEAYIYFRIPGGYDGPLITKDFNLLRSSIKSYFLD